MNEMIDQVDYNALPAALLPAFKRWQRIDFADDDTLCTEILQGAIEQFERNSGITVFKSMVILEPDATDFSNNVLSLNTTPINSIALTVPDPGEQVPHSDETLFTDLTGYVVGGAGVSIGGGDYVLSGRGIHGVRIYQLAGPWVEGMSLTIDTGYLPANLKPELRQTILQIAGHLYEYREILIPSAVDQPPMWLDQIMSGFWLPRV